MQPYFLPYAGYFRLFAASDLFVIYDCVQFPQPGWVHRNRLPDHSGVERWLTLPLKGAQHTVLIKDLQFSTKAPRLFAERLRRFSLVPKDPAAVSPILEALHDIGGRPVNYIERLLERAVRYLGFPWRTIRSSALDIPRSIRGQDRVLEVLRRLDAKRYVNSPGGRALYDAQAFANAGVELNFLSDYPGPLSSILTRILQEDRDALAAEINASALEVTRSLCTA
jgi:hypothetical protein